MSAGDPRPAHNNQHHRGSPSRRIIQFTPDSRQTIEQEGNPDYEDENQGDYQNQNQNLNRGDDQDNGPGKLQPTPNARDSPRRIITRSRSSSVSPDKSFWPRFPG